MMRPSSQPTSLPTKQHFKTQNPRCHSTHLTAGVKRHKKMAKKKKRHDVDTTEQQDVAELTINGGNCSSEKTKKKKIKKTENDKEEKIIPTVSVAVAASIIDNAQSLELATRLAGQIARAATIYRVDEIVVFDNNGVSMDDPTVSTKGSNDESSAAFFIRILRYLETPQYLRRSLFPKHDSLNRVGTLPPLDAPHHLRKHEWGSYREGVTLGERPPNSVGTLVDVGLSKNVVIDQVLEPGIRVTVAMGTDRNLDSGILRQVVPSSTPRTEEDSYWGYKVRYAPNLSSVIEKCPYEGGYDFVIGTSEHGQAVKSSELCIPAFRHLLIAIGGLAGLEESIEEDNKLKGKNAQDVFHLYLNLCPRQGSRTIRTEEAVFICLQYFQDPICKALQKA